MTEQEHVASGDAVGLEEQIERLSYRQLKTLREQLDQAMVRRRSDALAAFEKEREALVAEYDLSEAPPAIEAEYRSAVRIKYRDPETGSHWSGRGKKPDWLKQKLETGHDLEDFAVRETVCT